MDNEFDILKKNRKFILEFIEDLSMDQVNRIPETFNNNIVWNIAHLIATQQLLCYSFSDLPMRVPNEMVELYRKGTKPQGMVNFSEFEIFKEMFIKLPLELEQDHSNDIFKKYKAYTTSLDVTINEIDQAITFINFHEGIHLGSILALRKLV